MRGRAVAGDFLWIFSRVHVNVRLATVPIELAIFSLIYPSTSRGLKANDVAWHSSKAEARYLGSESKISHDSWESAGYNCPPSTPVTECYKS